MVYKAQDSDFEKINGNWIYKGQEKEVEIPEYINGELVTSTASMFAQAGNYWATPVTKVVLRYSNVKDMRGMFARREDAEKQSLNLSNFNTQNVTDMGDMFSNFQSSKELLDLSGFNTSSVTSMPYMFSGCNLQTIDLSSFDTSNVTNMNSMFFECKHLRSLDVSNFDTSNVTNMGNMFSSCYRLQNLDLSNFVIRDDAKTDGMLNIGNSRCNVYIGSEKDFPKFTKNMIYFNAPKIHIRKKYLDLEGLKVYNEKVTGLINSNKDEIEKLKSNDSQGLAVEIVSKNQLGEVKNNSIIFVKR